MKLDELIVFLRDASSDSDFRIPNLRNVLDCLEDLNSMIENKDVKDLFASVVKLIITMKNNGFEPPFKKMNAVLSGPPGVGKTTTSIIIAKTFASLGVIPKSRSLIEESISEELKIHYKKDIAETMTKVQDLIGGMMISLDVSHGDKSPEDIPEFVKDFYGKSQESCDLCQEIIGRYSKYFKEFSECDDITEASKPEKSDLPYVILGRGDFVGAHMGETSIKTKDILEENKGKVIIIEEAYTLFNSDRDSYGMEALTLINRYMDERSDDYIFIFNGYIELLNETIFKAQPGLKRRIQWRFDVQGYTPEGIFRIFEHQLSKYVLPKWTIDSRDIPKIKEFFVKNFKEFPHYGGDTERLILQCQLVYGELFFGKKCSDFIITYSILLKAFERFKSNSHRRSGSLPEVFQRMYM